MQAYHLLQPIENEPADLYSTDLYAINISVYSANEIGTPRLIVMAGRTKSSSNTSRSVMYALDF